MAEDLFRHWQRDPTLVKMTGKWMVDLDLKLAVGKFPQVSFTVYLEALVESLSNEVLLKLRKHITDILLDDLHIGVKPIPIYDSNGKLIGEMWSELV